MFPSFTTVEWAIISGGVVSSITLVFVFLDFYWSHLVTERSDVSIRKSVSRDSNYNSSRETNRINSRCTIVNEGKRSAVVRATKADIRFEPSFTEFSWEDMKEIDANKNPYVRIKHVDNNSIFGDSTMEGNVQFGSGRVKRLNSLMKSQESIIIDVVVDVEDNQEHYQIDYSDEIELDDN